MAGNEAYPLRRQICESRIRWYSSMAGSADKKGSEGPVAVDYSSLLERDFHNIADRTLEHLQERIEAYGEDLEVDGFDTDHAEGVLTVRLGSMGTYVINKQTPNRQIWLSSPVSGPARFDWHEDKKAWVYRRTKAKLMSLLEKELGELLKADIDLSE
ncbi:hypothetical protein O6H91_15G010300 [Diphasiastrum complanatum]|nr:hypothetical protein O6H91_15G010300 [Diphasiastrum complanatum]